MTHRLVVATPLPEHLEAPMLALGQEFGVEVQYDRDLLPPLRHAGDHSGDPRFSRDAAAQARFEAQLNQATILYGIPGESATALAQTVAANPDLAWVQTMAAGGGAQVVGAKLSPADYARITFTTSAGVHGDSLAEFAIMGILAGTKDLPSLQANQAKAFWPPQRTPVRQVQGSTVLILGLGEIGKATARRAKALGMTVIGSKRSIEPIADVDHVISNDGLAEAIGQADHIVVTLPGTQHTEGLLNAALLERAKRGVTVVNVGRGTVINEADLIAALESGQVGYAALDVFEKEPLAVDSPLWAMPNVLCAPHGMALDAREDDRIFELFRENLAAFVQGKTMRNVVDPAFGY